MHGSGQKVGLAFKAMRLPRSKNSPKGHYNETYIPKGVLVELRKKRLIVDEQVL
jgi:hypothetical protein